MTPFARAFISEASKYTRSSFLVGVCPSIDSDCHVSDIESKFTIDAIAGGGGGEGIHGDRSFVAVLIPFYRLRRDKINSPSAIPRAFVRRFAL